MPDGAGYTRAVVTDAEELERYLRDIERRVDQLRRMLAGNAAPGDMVEPGVSRWDEHDRRVSTALEYARRASNLLHGVDEALVLVNVEAEIAWVVSDLRTKLPSDPRAREAELKRRRRQAPETLRRALVEHFGESKVKRLKKSDLENVIAVNAGRPRGLSKAAVMDALFRKLTNSSWQSKKRNTRSR